MRSPESCGHPILTDTIGRESQRIANDERPGWIGLPFPDYTDIVVHKNSCLPYTTCRIRLFDTTVGVINMSAVMNCNLWYTSYAARYWFRDKHDKRDITAKRDSLHCVVFTVLYYELLFAHCHIFRRRCIFVAIIYFLLQSYKIASKLCGGRRPSHLLVMVTLGKVVSRKSNTVPLVLVEQSKVVTHWIPFSMKALITSSRAHQSIRQ